VRAYSNIFPGCQREFSDSSIETSAQAIILA
jgi:hypothetical protein